MGAIKMEELMVTLVFVMALLALLMWWLFGRIVVVPTLSVTTDKDSYFRGETVTISGSLLSDSTPIAGQRVALSIKPPVGDIYSLPSVTTDDEGKFSVEWSVPADAPPGTYTLTATALGVSATKTFTP